MRVSEAACISILLALTACSAAPVQETKNFAVAAAEIENAGTPLLDRLAVAERRIGSQRARRRATVTVVAGTTFVRSFTAEDAPYIATLGDPPNVAVFRSSLKVVRLYADTLIVFAEGKGYAETSAHVIAIAEGLKVLGGAADIAVKGSAAVTNVAAAVVPELKQIIDHAMQARSIEESRRLVVSGAPLIRALIQELRLAMPPVSAMLTSTAIGSAQRAVAETPGTTLKQYLDQTAFETTQIANYIVLLNRLEGSFNNMVDAYERDSDRVTLSRIAKEAAVLAADAEAFRKAYHTYRQ